LLLPLLYHTRREEQNKSIIPKGWKKALLHKRGKKEKKRKVPENWEEKKRKRKRRERERERERRCKETKKEMEVSRESSYYLPRLPTYRIPRLSFPQPLQVLVFSFQLNNNNLTSNYYY